jgi:Domain of unknown function (DUF4175)
MTKNNYDLLIEKLDAFIRKYYLNQLIRGTLYSVGLVLLLFLGINFLEHYFYFGAATRKTMFYSFCGISAVAMSAWVLVPFLQYFRLGKVISHDQAAQIVGNHFTDVKDKLLNVLQLRRQAENTDQQALILASINQKSDEIKLVPFKAAIDLTRNRKYLRYALPPLLLLFLVMMTAPSLIKDSTFRLVNNNREFERPAPFHFVVEKSKLKVVQFNDFDLKVKIEGEVMPSDAFIDIDGYQYRLQKDTSGAYFYKFSNVQKDTKFHLFSGAVASETLNLDVLKKPNIAGFEVNLDYPAYTGRIDEALSNVGDVIVPVGTNMNWLFKTQNTDKISIHFSDKKNNTEATRKNEKNFTFNKRATTNETYKLFVSNPSLPNGDSVLYTITVISDLSPTIAVEKFEDSTDVKALYFLGQASDDYGMNSLTFNYSVKRAKTNQSDFKSINLPKPEGKQTQYKHTLDLTQLALQAGDVVTYYFEVYDNDAVNGSKSAKTNPMTFARLSTEQYEKQAAKNNEAIKKDLEKAFKDTKKLQEDMKKMQDKLLQEKDVNWQSKKEFQNMMERQQDIEKNLREAQENFKENMKNQSETSKPDEELLKKQEQMQKMFDDLLSDEMKDLMKQIEEMMQKLEKDQALDKMDDMKLNNEQMSKELDRMMEMYKKLELENLQKDQINKLEELAKKEDDLNKKTDENKNPEELKKEQEEINKEFEKVQEKLEEIKEKNKELEKPEPIQDRKEDAKDVKKDLDDSKEKLDKKDSAGASKPQKNASKKMKKMADNMKMEMKAGDMEAMEEDMKALRQLLENLVGLSFEQEGLMKETNITVENTPKYTALVQRQYKVKDDFKMVEDSLQALSKRVFQIQSFVTEKVTDVKLHLKNSLNELEDRHKPQAADQQQRTMTNINDLALMLSETLDQMQKDAAGAMPGSQSCEKPGGKGAGKDGKKPSDKLGKGQSDLNEQMKKMRDQMKKGEGQPGGMSKQFAQMAAKQAALRNALKEMQKEKQSRGQGDKQAQEIIDQMEKVETELVNKKLTNETVKRQEEILTRLLENERAEREREYEEKRKAEVAKGTEPKIPPSLQEYIKKREAEIDMFKSVSPSLKPYYKGLVEEYFKALKRG